MEINSGNPSNIFLLLARNNFSRRTGKQSLFVHCVSVKTDVLEISEATLTAQPGTYLEMCAKSFLHEELLVTVWEVADEFRIGVIVKVSSKVVHASEEFAAELAWHRSTSMRLCVLLKVLGREKC